MSTINGSTHIDINQRIPKYKGFDVIASDFSTEIDLAIGNFKNLLCYTQEQQEEITKLKKALEIANDALVKIDSSNDDMKYFNSEIDSILKEAQKQIKEIMEG